MTSAVVTVVPANQASWEDLRTIFGTRGPASQCYCQRQKVRDIEWQSVSIEDRAARLRTETNCDQPAARHTSGLVAYLGDEPAGWCAVEPRTAFLRLRNSPVTWTGRNEDKADDSVWAVACFVTRAGYRHRGVSRALAAAAVDFARERGARAIEGYPMVLPPGQEITWDEMRVGSRSIFADAGFAEVSRPTKRRAVMRVDFS